MIDSMYDNQIVYTRHLYTLKLFFLKSNVRHIPRQLLCGSLAEIYWGRGGIQHKSEKVLKGHGLYRLGLSLVQS